jgi:hypothetical protein
MLRRSRRWLAAAVATGLLAFFADDTPPSGALALVRVTVATNELRPVLVQERPVPRRVRPTRTYKPLPP